MTADRPTSVDQFESTLRDILRTEADVRMPEHLVMTLDETLRSTPTAPERRWLPTSATGLLRSTFGAIRFVVAAVVVALFGGFLLAALLTQSSEESVPVVGASASPTAQARQTVAATSEAVASPESEEVEPVNSVTPMGTFTSAGALTEARRGGHTATLLSDGRVLVLGGDYWDADVGGGRSVAAAEVWEPRTASFSSAGSLIEGRQGYTATLLPDGRVLIIGGRVFRDDAAPSSAEALAWDPATASFDPAGTLAHARYHHSATLLRDGRVLVIGGHDGDADRSAEVWDPATASFSPAGSLAEARTDGHSATLLSDGRVLVVGGAGRLVRSAEVWDPATASFSPAGSLALFPNDDHTATLLSDGRVLVVGTSAQGKATAEVWDPMTTSFSPAGSLPEGRAGHTATLLSDGRVLVVGGSSSSKDTAAILATAEIWDPVTASFSPAGSLVEARSVGHTATLLPDGRVLIVGGQVGHDNDTPWNPRFSATAEVWDPMTASFSPAGSLVEGRSGHTATLLPDGRVLVVGGGSGDEPITPAEVWEPGDG